MIHLSQAAAKEIQRLLSKQNSEVFFRLQVQSGGCSGLFYDLGFDKVLRTGDQIFKSSGIAVVVDAQSWNIVNSLTIDYSEDLMGGGFRFYNPQAIALCGCGNSFSIDQ